ncbi:MAG: protease modulator HflC [Burkholderiaceae bacterium]|jgi:membrane protease subunit HflC|nr:protease modulator HflC [Burkholderiaceae bacterium]
MAEPNNNASGPISIVGTLGFIVTTVVLVAVILASSLFVVDQRQFGLVKQFGGKVQRVITEPGLHLKWPLMQDVTYLDKRLLTLTSSDTDPVLTAEKQRVVIDWYVRWRIANPLAYVQNVGQDEITGEMQLKRVVRNAFQEEINRRTLQELISSKREEVMGNVKQAVAAAVKSDKPWGIEIVDVRLTRADYAESITASVYQRMQAERERVANELRSKGDAEAMQIRAEADSEAERIRGEGDAEANRIYADAFGKDPGFAKFYRQLDAWRASIGKGDVLVIDPANSDFFKDMLHPPGAGAQPEARKK